MNNEITEDYVSFETAKLLKEKGFDELTRFVWYDKCPPSISRAKSFERKLDYFYINKFTETPSRFCNSGDIPDYITGNVYCAPTIQMAMKWLREEYRMYVHVSCTGEKNWEVEIQSYDGKDYSVSKCTQFLGCNIEIELTSYEEAAEAGIKYCLENLI